MRKPLIAANWKMHKTITEAVTFCHELEALKPSDQYDLLLCPGFTCLSSVKEHIAANWGLGAQNCYFEAKGAFTGEISLGQLIDAGCSYVIIGHSERRQLFGEDDQLINKKVKAALEAGLIPVLCVGETLAERRAGQALARLAEQFAAAVDGLADDLDLTRLVIAYEPIWAIGTGETASAADAQEAIAHLRQLAAQKWPAQADCLRILYGGSVKPDNAKELGAQPDIDGALVGGASLEAKSFFALAQEFVGQ